MSLSVLLDYRPEDTKVSYILYVKTYLYLFSRKTLYKNLLNVQEHSFEVSLFAELFNEMLMRDFGFRIYRSLSSLPEKTKEKDEDKKKDKKDDKRDDKKDDKRKEDEKKSSKKDEKRDDKKREEAKDKKDDKDAKCKVDDKDREKEKNDDEEEDEDDESDVRKKEFIFYIFFYIPRFI